MPKAELSEIYLIVFMMSLLILVSAGSIFFFLRTLKRERKAQAEEKAQKQAASQAGETEKKAEAKEIKVA